MAVYQPEDYEKVIRRIQEKIEACSIEMGECLSEEAIAAFEASHKVKLPQAYRLFLQKVGNGCKHVFNSLEQSPCEKLSEPFMLESFWLWEDDDREDALIQADMENKVYRGNLELADMGCGMSYNLIVTGKCRGEVWNFTDVGVQPCCERQDFLGWFELWLDNGDEVDYFKDYVYDEADFESEGFE